MINVNQMTSQLARMPDQALQQYAQMHKNDPYIMALAMSESNRRKSMRTGAQMNAPEEPKVVDQAIQGMASPMPEDVGIGQLPAGEMNFAGGGIVAFSDGGDVPRYQDRGLVQGVPSYLQGLYASGTERERERRRKLEAAAEAERTVLSPAQVLNEARDRAMAEANKGSVFTPMPGKTPAPAFNDPRIVGATPPQQTVGAPPAASGPGAGGSRPPPAAQSSPQAGGIARLPLMQSPAQMYLNAQEAVPLVDPAGGMREDLGKELLSGAEGRARKLREDIEKEGDVFAGRGARIGKREEKLKSYESTNQSLALLNAGLAIMSTPGGLATAIGKGARVGTEQYAAGLDKIRAAQERIEEARDNLDTLRLNRSDMNKKEIRASEAEIDRAKVEAKKMGIEGIMAASDLRQRQASDLFKGMVEQDKTRYMGGVDLLGRQMSANATMAAANAPGQQERMFTRLGGGNLEKGIKTYSDIMGPEAKGETAMIAAYAKDPVKLKLLEQTDPVLAQMIKSRIQTMMVPGAQNAPGPGPVRP